MNNRSRVVVANEVSLDQADFFQEDGFTRVSGLASSDVSLQVFQNNTLLDWTLVTGVAVDDESVRSGHVYWSEISGAAGVYSVRLRPSAVGYWRVILTYAAGAQILAQDLDVLPDPQVLQSPVTTRFI